MAVIAATPPTGMLAKAPIPVTAVVMPAEESAVVKAPKPIAEAWAMVKAFLYFLPLGGSDQPRAPIRLVHQIFFGDGRHRAMLVNKEG